ncbi:hypothetical protein [Massilia antarctica]|uniref:hypothetical protein n=1 Tax=Massilia antarctica TaxID=2765360 RepID=UPI0006BD382B|nr:hypothetical protein [Massilia sp. H27-R4]MCY0915844.1 hypothetical protein [Massilia sp. H27-R4]CUI06111.1 hypothetical protein BN2497_6999 [Janthinobacterium sp. CG23_2]CUU29897.1 hypothetical protein BN3177_6999 [Janthinobacterium sp. CG23_2]
MKRLLSETMLLAVLGGCCDDQAPPPQALPAAPAAPAPVRSPPAPPSMPPPRDIEQLRQEVAGLRREVAELRMMLTRAPGAAPPAGLAAPSAPDTQALAPAETMFRAEQVDPVWSRYAASAVRAALARANAGLESQVRRLECRIKTCRVEINPTSADLLESSMAAVLANVGAAIPNMTATQVGSDDGSEATVLYLTR